MSRITWALLVLAACEPPLPQPGPSPDAGQLEDGGSSDGGTSRVVTQLEGSVAVSRINAMDNKTFTPLDLDTGAEVPFEAASWDVAFQRFHIRSRGGASGDGGVQVAALTDAGFSELTTAPPSGWLEDQADGPDENQDLDTVFETAEPWYAYDLSTHVLTPRPVVYVIRTDSGAFFKVKIEGYYDPAGTPANLTLRWAPVLPP